MCDKKAKKPSYRVVLAHVKKEMAKPRVAGSAKIKTKKQRTTTVKEAA